MAEKMSQENENAPFAADASAAMTQEQEKQIDATDATSATETAEATAALQQELEAEKKISSAHIEKIKRVQAEMENLRKKVARDIESAHKYALERFIKELLPVIDSVELGMSASKNTKNIEELCEGMALTLKKFVDVMERFSVEVIDPIGEKFNPDLHEAVSAQTVEGQDAGFVSTVMQKGYQLNGRLIRPAMVIVTK